MNKTEQAKQLWKDGEKSKALRLFKSFRLGLSKEQKRAIEIHHEVVNGGKRSFYTAIGVDLDEIQKQAELAINTHLIKA